MLASESIISVRLSIPEHTLFARLFPGNDRWYSRLLWRLLPEHIMAARLFPGNNRWASGLLCRLLRNRIEAAGVTVVESSWGFPFNRSFYLFTVAQRPAGPMLAVVWAEIAAVGLLAWCQIAWRTEDKLSWRLFYPKSGVFAAPAQDEFEAESRIFAEHDEAIRKL